jgi:hypothetical protein
LLPVERVEHVPLRPLAERQADRAVVDRGRPGSAREGITRLP